MRAVFDSSFILENPIITEATKLHHFNKVLRIKTGEEIVILKGDGNKFYCKVEEVSKKSIALAINKHEFVERGMDLALALAITKKEALDTNVKQAIELGVRKLIFLYTDFSQKYEINLERMDRLIVSAIEQCNEAYYPQIEIWNDLTNKAHAFSNKIAFVSEIDESDEISKPLMSEVLVLIGPEGGFSHSEIDFLKLHFQCIKLKTNILRSTTALPVAIGYLYGKCI